MQQIGTVSFSLAFVSFLVLILCLSLSIILLRSFLTKINNNTNKPIKTLIQSAISTRRWVMNRTYPVRATDSINQHYIYSS